MKLFAKLHFHIMILVISIGMASCSKDNTTPDMTNQLLDNTMISGTWSITKFIDSEKDETSHFSGYNFVFSNNGVITSTNGTNTYEGIWSITDSRSDDDDSADDLDFNIYFDLSNEFEDLNDDWDVINYSENKVELFDVSGGNGGTDYLTFEKF